MCFICIILNAYNYSYENDAFNSLILKINKVSSKKLGNFPKVAQIVSGNAGFKSLIPKYMLYCLNVPNTPLLASALRGKPTKVIVLELILGYNSLDLIISINTHRNTNIHRISKQ